MIAPATSRCLRTWEWRVWILLIYTIPIQEASKNVLWALAVALSLLRVSLEKTSLPAFGRVGWCILAWLATGIWASFFAIEPAASWKGVWDMFRGSAMFGLAILIADTPERRASMIRHMICSSAFAAAVGLWDYLWALWVLKAYIPRLAVQLRSVGHFNQSGAYLAMSWMVALAGALNGQVFAQWFSAALASSLIGLGLLGTTSRTAAVVTTVGTLLMLWRTRSPSWLRALFAGVVLFTAITLVGSSSLRARVFYRGSFHNRVEIWRSAVETGRSRPWTGVGLNNFKNIPLTPIDDLQGATVDHAHNLYFNALAQTGMPGFAALLAMLATMGGAIWRQRTHANAESLLIFRAAGGVWLVIILTGLSNTPLHHELAMFFFATMGLMTAESAGSHDIRHGKAA